MEPTIVLVHGAFADSSSWNGVVDALLEQDFPVIAAANPLRGLASDAAAVADLVGNIEGPVVLVGHSYGGAVISNVPAEAGEIAGLVYVAAFAPEPGDTCFSLSTLYPGSTLAGVLWPVNRSDGTTDLTIIRDHFHDQFAADLPAAQTARMAVTQRPVTQEALLEPSGPEPLWRTVPSRFVIGDADRNIPAEAQRFMAERAGSLQTLELAGASHAVAVSHPRATAEVIREAAAVGAVR